MRKLILAYTQLAYIIRFLKWDKALWAIKNNIEQLTANLTKQMSQFKDIFPNFFTNCFLLVLLSNYYLKNSLCKSSFKQALIVFEFEVQIAWDATPQDKLDYLLKSTLAQMKE